MKDFPLDDFIINLRATDVKREDIYDIILSHQEHIKFIALIKILESDLYEYGNMILNILRPVIKSESNKARYKNSFKPSKTLVYRDTNEPVKMSGYHDPYRKQFTYMAYIGLYHKVENAEELLLKSFNKALNADYKDLNDISFNNKNKDIFKSRDRLRVIANCFKHNQGLADSQVCEYIPKLQLGEYMNLNFRDFKKDLTGAKEYYLQVSVFLSMYYIKKIFNTKVPQEERDIKMSALRSSINKDLKQIIKKLRNGKLD